MIGILSNINDQIFLKQLDLPFTLLNKYDPANLIDGLFIDWIPKVPVYRDAWMKQASLLQEYIKMGIPIVIFDRGFSLTEKEVNWVKKFNVYLFEPALNSDRKGFNYLPEWIHNFEVRIDDEDREYDLAYSSHNIEYYVKEFEKWFKDYARLFPNKKVSFSSFEISDFKLEEYKNNNLINLQYNQSIFDSAAFTAAIDTKKSYEIGYFNPVNFLAMNRGCLPLLPFEHKYFHGMFNGLIMKDLKEMDYYVSLYGRVKDIIIQEIFDRIKTDWPEFTVDYAASVIRSCYE